MIKIGLFSTKKNLYQIRNNNLLIRKHQLNPLNPRSYYIHNQ